MKTLLVAALGVALLATCFAVMAPDVAHAAREVAVYSAMLVLPASSLTVPRAVVGPVRADISGRLARLPKLGSTPDLLGSARPVPRAIVAARVRADATDPKKVVAELLSAFEDFKTSNDEKLKAKVDDVVMTEKVDRINEAVGKLQAACDELAIKLAAEKAGPGKLVGDIEPTSPEALAAFKAHMRRGEVSAALTKSADTEGGYFAPVEWDRTVTDKLKQISKIRENARVISISVAGFKKLFNDRAVGSGWVGETASRPATTTPAIGSLDFTPGELYANPAISMQLLQDAALDLEQWLAAEVEVEFSRQEGIAFLSGDGTNKPHGLLTYVTGAANAARHPWGAIPVVPTGAAAALTGDGFIDLMYSLPSEFAAGAKLYINRLSLGAARKLKDGQGNYLWQPAYVAGEPQTINGSPVVEVPGMPAVAAGNIAALYGDMEKTYLVIDRIGINVLRDPYTNKPFVHFYTTKRVGGGVYNPEPMRALKVAAS
ncbi:phage major capsid protein [Methylopila sp. Yamaguchi]|uniref:phage major capsid protein n=1 Tax=Methylopila sp. Yamaguchi TaxID=1437817 RepID=UPI000CB9CC1D|nr:phage major capsid protein [Methylopila sp. Yamaguchi]GBD48093.1 HK97 family phage major capsid protein [Methylopila sp. Yamaguchi]